MPETIVGFERTPRPALPPPPAPETEPPYREPEEFVTYRPRPRRPTQVTILGALLVFQGLAFMLVAGAIQSLDHTADLVRLIDEAGQQQLLPADWFSLLLLYREEIGWFLLGLTAVVCGLAMLQMMSWARFASQVVQLIVLVTALLSYFEGDPQNLEMLVAVGVVWYLNQREVRDVFARRV